MDDLTPEERRVVEWLREDARQTEKEAKRILMNSYGLSFLEKTDWNKLVALKQGIADAIERLEHRKAPQ